MKILDIWLRKGDIISWRTYAMFILQHATGTRAIGIVRLNLFDVMVEFLTSITNAGRVLNQSEINFLLLSMINIDKGEVSKEGAKVKSLKVRNEVVFAFE